MSPSKMGGGEASPLAAAPAHRSLSGAEGAVSKGGGQGSSATPLSGAVPRNAPGWSEITLREAGVVLIDCDHRTPESSPTGFPYVMIPQIKGGVIDFSSAKLISPKDFAEWTRKANPTENDIVLSRRCNPGETAYVPSGTKFALGQNLVLLRATSEKISPIFLRWLVRGPEWWEQVGRYINVGAVFESLRCADIPKFILRIPPISVQKSIAQILGTLDDKIELNRRINQTLEEMAQALFKSWFVDFDPVRAKADVYAAAGDSANLTEQLAEWAAMRVISGKSDDELTRFRQDQPDAFADLARTAALFPSRLVESELGPIPEGWCIRSLGDYVQLQNGFAFKSSAWVEAGFPVIKIGDVKPGIIGSGSSFVAAETVRGLDRFRLYRGDLLIGMTGYVGETGLVPQTVIAMYLNQRVGRFVLKDQSQIGFYFCLVRRQEYKSYVESKATGSAQANVSGEQILSYNSCFPSDDIINRFACLSHEWICAILDNYEVSQSLRESRDSLLPKLLSGELEIPDELLAEVNL